MRVFGCLVYVKENKFGKDKFEERGDLVFLLGTHRGKKGIVSLILRVRKF